MLDGRWKASIERGLKPVGIKLRRAGINADVLTGVGVVMAAASAVAIATGHLSLGLLLLVLTGLPDALDGAVAKAAGTAGPAIVAIGLRGQLPVARLEEFFNPRA